MFLCVINNNIAINPNHKLIHNNLIQINQNKVVNQKNKNNSRMNC